jgi:hypothetical protein
VSAVRFPDPPRLTSLSPADTTAFRNWASELNRALALVASQLSAANRSPFWDVSVSVYPTRTLPLGATAAQIQDSLGTLILDLKGKGVVA